MRAWVTSLALASLTITARPADACAPAMPAGVAVTIAAESAIIVWDEAARREHFIRRASFHASTQGAFNDFGFLVPTPDKPELREVADEVFRRLEEATKPAVVHDYALKGVEPTALCLLTFLTRGGAPASSTAAAAPVRVLHEQRVAGYDAVVLEADDPKALADWLTRHGYEARPTLTAWLAPYVSMRWKITAFKIATNKGETNVGSTAVQMSFTTERPFYPYREPADQRENLPADAPSDRLLRLFFIGPSRVDGAIAGTKKPWPGTATWSDRIDQAAIVGGLPFSVPAGSWLTAFEDKAYPRPGTDDLFFTKTPDAKPLKPPPIVINHDERLPLPLDLVGGGALVVALFLRYRKRRGAA